MFLAIEAGNSNVKLALCSEAGLAGRWAWSSASVTSAEDLADRLASAAQSSGITLAALEGTIISSVVPVKTPILTALAGRITGQEPLVIGQDGLDLGIPVRAVGVGHDRLVGAVGALARHPPPLLVIDFGTATTFNLVAPDGGFEGGAIAPGAHLMVHALHRDTAQLPEISLEKPASVVGKETSKAIQSGIFWGFVGLVEGQVARFRREAGWPLKVIATGGYSPLFKDDCPSIDDHNPHLTLLGLQQIYQNNRKCLKES